MRAGPSSLKDLEDADGARPPWFLDVAQPDRRQSGLDPAIEQELAYRAEREAQRRSRASSGA